MQVPPRSLQRTLILQVGQGEVAKQVQVPPQPRGEAGQGEVAKQTQVSPRP